MKQILFLLFVVSHCLIKAQAQFGIEIELLDKSQYSHKTTDICSADLNNDGFNELIVSSYYDDAVMWYENINGDLQYKQRHLLSQNMEIPTAVTAADLDGDGLNDIVVVSEYGLKVVWFKNLGNTKFSEEIIIDSSLDYPLTVAADDFDNDGDIDLLVGQHSSSSVYTYQNNGNGTFSNKTEIADGPYSTTKVAFFDINNDGLCDAVLGQADGGIYWLKNLGNGNFDAKIHLGWAGDDIKSIEFLDVNNDGFYDLVTSDRYNDRILYFKNQEGISFSSAFFIDSSISDPWQVRVKDMDNDGLSDVIVSTWQNDKIGWYKNNGDSSFSALKTIITNISDPECFIADDINNDGNNEIVSSSDLPKLSCFTLDPITDIYKETIINFYFSAANAVKVADLNNDGKNDIVSAMRAIVWNKNNGNDGVSSYRLISDSISMFVNDIEIKDMDDDGWLDIVAVTESYIEVYTNNGDETFYLSYQMPRPAYSNEIEVADINGDSKPDILFTTSNSGIYKIEILTNQGNNTYIRMTPIFYNDWYWEPNKIACGDTDKDGDIDIVVSSFDASTIQLLENDGVGNFNYLVVLQFVPTYAIALADVNNDGYLDIISGGYYMSNKGLYWSANHYGTFTPQVNIDNSTGVDAIALADIDNNGYKDLVCAYYNEESLPYSDQTFYYLFTEAGFGSKVMLSNDFDGFSLTRNLCVGDINNDERPDIVTSFYYDDKVSYFLNTTPWIYQSTKEENSSALTLYPVPFLNDLYWNYPNSRYNISVYNELGIMVVNKINYELNRLYLGFLKPGTYYIKFENNTGIVTKKVIKI